MTTAPQNLRTVRSLLLEHLGPHGLASLEVGIVGDTAHTRQGNSYHLGLPEQASTGYAATESPRDKAGLCEYASALDVGTFEVQVGGTTRNLRTFSAWLVAQCASGTPDSRDIREVIYSLDGSTVRRWDRLGKRTSGDSSHLTHTHISFFRDATKAGRDLTPLFRRYLTTIGLIQEDDVSAADVFAYKVHNDYTGEDVPFATYVRSYNNSLARLEGGLRELYAAVKGIDPDEQAIAAAVLAGLPAGKIAAAIPPELAKQVADELARRMVS